MEFKMCSVNGVIYKDKKDLDTLLNKKTLESDIERENFDKLNDFFKVLSICHTVMIENDEQLGEIKYQASSPDELALIDGAKAGGYKFIARNVNNIGIEIKHSKTKEVYEVLNEFPFDSTRKRMSLIVKKKGSEEILMMTKGADSIMIPRLLIAPEL